MRIHHFTIPAKNPELVARVLAELFGAKVIPLPHPQGNLLVYAGDPDGTAIEVWPESTRCEVGSEQTVRAELPLPERWPHHAYVTSDTCTADQILELFEREGWRAYKAHNGPPHAGFSLVRGWIENQMPIEIGGAEMRAQYEKFFQQAVAAGR